MDAFGDAVLLSRVDAIAFEERQQIFVAGKLLHLA